jgi:nucleotide-binding universal stress UspA family protein
MQTRESIVVGTDGSERAERAVDRAGELARALGATVHVVSAYSEDRVPLVERGREGERHEAQQYVDRAQERLAKLGVECETHLSPSQAAKALLQIADEQGARMIIVGNRGMTGAQHLLGSVPNHVSHHAKCDVLIVSTT